MRCLRMVKKEDWGRTRFLYAAAQNGALTKSVTVTSLRHRYSYNAGYMEARNVPYD